MEAKIGIEQKLLTKVAFELSRLLADEFTLYTKTRNAHWNIEGPHFHILHKLFEDQYELLDEAIDDVAERVRSLGHYAPASLKDFLKLTRLSEQSLGSNDSAAFLKELLQDHETIIVTCRGNIKTFMDDYQDAGSSDFITGLMERHEKMAWMLRSHLV
ncbi:MAG TPA: DNA starvation/stationary phase protection protein [Chryseolinea sp.]